MSTALIVLAVLVAVLFILGRLLPESHVHKAFLPLAVPIRLHPLRSASWQLLEAPSASFCPSKPVKAAALAVQVCERVVQG